MANGYECGIEMRGLEKMIKDFAFTHGRVSIVLESLLDYIIGYLDIEGKPIDGWSYNAKETECFADMTQEYFRLMSEQLKTKSWYDAWGDLFMSLQTGGGGRGQFFTPDDICEVMAEISLKNCTGIPHTGSPLNRMAVSDPTAGSARNLLAAHAYFLKKGWRKPYLCAEDVDFTCCKMSAINLCVHGCFGEVVCHNTLTEPQDVRVGYVINEGLLMCDRPSIRRLEDPKEFYCTTLWKEREAQHKESVTPHKNNNQPKQLTIW